MNKNQALAYLYGLIVGRGHILSNDKRIIIEFSHKNKTVLGIAHCPICGSLVTKSRSGNGLVCKDNGHKLDKSTAKVYEQVESTKKSLNEIIIPFLKTAINGDFSIVGNNVMTLLTIDLKDDPNSFKQIQDSFSNKRSFDEFVIPSEMYSADEQSKIEFINGLLDTAGFPSVGGWLNRDGKNGHGRMRAYFQIVRNWKLPVQLDNFLRSEFSLPVQTIDWGHPNIRDANLEDYFNSNPTSWSREHQLKFYPEYYSRFKFRIKHKQSLFIELVEHNKRMVFDDLGDWFPPRKIPLSQLKAYHPGESDPRIPLPARRHFDAFWQINEAMGCLFMKKKVDEATNKEAYLISGSDESMNVIELKKKFHDISQNKTDAIFKQYADKKAVRKQATSVDENNIILEKELYAPLVTWLSRYLAEKYKQEAEVFDVSAVNLNALIKQSAKSLEAFEFCNNYRIKPDVVGFLLQTSEIVFIEAKITAMNIQNIGQLLGYCLVARPKEAILVSTKKPSAALLKTLQANPEILDYEVGIIKIATWENNKLSFIEGLQ